ncbi:hypothetical protein CEXT_647711 [Caerostris extrusa]|uniref:Uncharacterized protein n=1 Tax=Caerostris extrusa TaxID=172846 RepID=A0AAV4NX54_CAEEX|nr:hypothetical protein CEXT_647711 [Caerostris extrusa]
MGGKLLEMKKQLALTSPSSIDGHVKCQRPVTEEHRLLFVPSNISQVSGCSKVTVQNRMMETGKCFGNFCWPEIESASE